RLKSALWYALGNYVDEECLHQNLNATPQFIAALTELVYTQIANTSRDLETFAKHAGRSTINTSDVMLLSRRNEGLENVLRRELDDIKARDGTSAPQEKKARGRPAGKGKAKQ
ncbi:putative apoptosis-inducing TAF9-like domain 1 family protein, partial [Lophiostoma macrostomum CBS 122681]